MSYQNKSDAELEKKVQEDLDTMDASAFEKHIMQCCKAPEWELRKWLKKVLIRAGFEIFEDGYRTERADKEKKYETVHNMLAIRGNPKVCLVAHTDVCRDHESLTNNRYSGWEGGSGYHHWMRDEQEEENKEVVKSSIPKINPVIKNIEINGEKKRIITDENFQIGGDDRLGCGILSYIAINSGYDVAIALFSDEEIGLKSARMCEFPQLKEFDLLMEIDRGNHSDQLVIKISNEILCSYDMACRLLEIAYDMGKPRAPVVGMSTDIYAIKSRGMCKNACNITCGYHNSVGSSKNEYIDIEEARDTLKYVSNVVKSFYLED